MSKPLLSVCLITYNHALYIRQSIDSILMQNVNFPIEVIIADDFSTDGTREIILDYQSKHPVLIEPLLQQHNVGPQRNYINLLKSARGKYIAYLEGDDYWSDSCKLQKQVDFLENNDSFIASFHNVQILDDQILKEPIYIKGRKKVVTFKDLAKGDYLKSCSLVFKNDKSYLRPLLNFEVPSEDTALGLCLLQDKKAYYMDEIMAIYRLHNGGVFSKISASQKYLWGISTQKKLIAYFSYRPEKFYLNKIKWNYYLKLANTYAIHKDYTRFLKIYCTCLIPSILYRISIKEIVFPVYSLIKLLKHR